MKKISLYISALALAAFGMASCADNWETPPMDVPTEGADIEPTLTIAELKAMYWQDTESYGTPVTALADGSHAIIKGTIVSSTESGNIYKAVYVQDSTAAICIGIDTASVNSVLPMGIGVAIDVTGLQIGRYSGAMQLGKADGSTVNRITYKELRPHVALDYFGGKLDTTVVTLEQLARPSQQDIREMGGKLVRINGVKFQEAGQDFAEGSNTSRHITDSLGNNSIIVYDSPYADFAYDTMPYGIGDVVGILSNYRTQWQLLLIDIDGVIGFDGVGAPDEDVPAPELPDQFKDAMSVQQALDLIASGQNDPNAEVMVFGRISSIDNVDTSYGNATYYMMDHGGKKALEVYRGYWLDGAKFTSENQLKVGEYLVVQGKLVNYNGTAEFTSGSKVVYYFGETDTPDGPTDIPPVPTGVISVAEALDYIAKGGQANDANVRVKGIISKIDSVDTGSYGNAEYNIVDEMGSTQVLKVYRGYWLDGAKFTSADQIEVGAEVIVEGKLVNYNGTPEFTSGSKIVSYNGETGSGDNPGDDNPGTTPDLGEGEAGTVVFDFTHPESLTPSYSPTVGSTPDNANTYDAVSNVTFINNGVGVTATKGNSTDARIYYQSTGKIQYRIYTGATLTVASSLPITSIQFEFNNAQSILKGSDGADYSNENTQALPNGAKSMTFSAPGTVQINKITVVTAE